MRSCIRFPALAASVVLAGSLAACVQAPPRHSSYPQSPYPAQQAPAYGAYPDQRGTEYGTVSYVEALHARSRSSGAGAIIGAVVGGVLGNQIGHGMGRAAATAAGAVGGAVAGNAIEGQTGRVENEGYRITIQLDQGGQRAYDVPAHGDLRPGDRVRMYGGQISRM